MFRTPVDKSRSRHKSFVSSLAFALALVGGTAVGLTAVATPAYAKEKAKYTKDFVEAYKPLEDIVNKAKDTAGLDAGRPLVQPMVDKITNDDERFAGGGLILQLGLKLKDQGLQRQGLILQLDSGQVPPERLAQYNYFVGGMFWQDKDYEGAKKYLTQAFDLGYTGDTIGSLIGGSYFNQDQYQQGLAKLMSMEKAREAKGSKLSEDAIRRALQTAYNQNLGDQVADWGAMLVSRYPSADAWNVAVEVVLDTYELSSDQALDLYRLLRLNGALKTTREYVDYINAIDPRRLSNEALPVIQDGIKQGLLKPDDAFVKESLQVASSRAPKDKSEAEEIANEGRTASTGIAARAAGDNYLALGMPEKAVKMYKIAGQKGGVEADRLQMRTGVAETEAGDYDAATQQFQQVTGKRVPVAKMWLAYIFTKQHPEIANAPDPSAPAPAAANDSSS